MLAYLDGNSIYLSIDGKEAEKIVDVDEILKNRARADFVSVNSEFVLFATRGQKIYSYHIENKEIQLIGAGISAFNTIGEKVYVIDKGRYDYIREIGTGKKVRDKNFELQLREIVDTNDRLYLYDYEMYDASIFINDHNYFLMTWGVQIDDDKEVDYQIDALRWKGSVLSPAHIAVSDDEIYQFTQNCHQHRTAVNQDYKYKLDDVLSVYDITQEKGKTLYTTRNEDPSEQICGFSVRKNELYLLDTGKLYVADLEGKNKKEIADFTGHKSLSFEYAAGKLWVYDEDNNIILTY